ncbi:hypothetical protein SRIMHP_40105 (plasmid) [Streptomyces rimosus subsp. rimosus]|nr:hypothetical protein SRIMHP_40105 [Streptomyces rimosus subsp. rimosus]UTJ18449.1 hypothetical protein SRIMDV3_40000 [Streptomyces rimosus subsp. rimosus]
MTSSDCDVCHLECCWLVAGMGMPSSHMESPQPVDAATNTGQALLRESGTASLSRKHDVEPHGDLETVLEPVCGCLWDQLGPSGARRTVEKAFRRELRYAAGVVGPERAGGFWPSD